MNPPNSIGLRVYPPVASVARREAAARRLLHFYRSDLRTNVYIDGFNFYYGALRKTPYRWVNPEQLCRFQLPKNTISRIKYFTVTHGPGVR